MDGHAAPLTFDGMRGEGPPSPRTHTITLCCAHSVEGMVEEVARNLRGMGFGTTVVCGGQARDALMGRKRDHDEPTIYVVCVQGALKDTVLKPLRTALATHGGPNEHLFVAVLDLSLPLSMVGQIRRFAEAIERMPGAKLPPRRDGLGERRQWREHIGPTQMNDVQTRTYRSLKVVELQRSGPLDPVAARAKRPPSPPGPRPIVSQRKPAKVSATRKYKAVTGPEPLVPAARPQQGKTVLYADVPTVRRHRIQVPGIETKTVAEPPKPRRPPPVIGSAIAAGLEAPTRSRAPIILLIGAVVVGAAVLLASGVLRDYLPALGGEAAPVATAEPEPDAKDDAQTNARGKDEAKAEPEEPDQEPEPEPEPEPEEPESPEPEPEPEAEAPESPEPEPGPEEPEDEPEDEPEEPEPKPDPELEPEDEVEVEVEVEEDEDEVEISDEDEGDEGDEDDAEPASDSEQALAAAIASGKVKATNRLFVARNLGDKTSYHVAKRRCATLEINGIDNWRLAFPNELRVLGGVGMLRGSYWSIKSDSYDRAYALVYESDGRRIATWSKNEGAGRVTCVTRRPDPEK